jgi:DNA mismatch repair protein MutL
MAACYAGAWDGPTSVFSHAPATVILGQLPAQEGEDLIVLDQHDAHKRILYEKLRENLEAAPVTLENPTVAMLTEDLATEA